MVTKEEQKEIDAQCFVCTNFFTCDNRFKKANCENFKRSWGTCKKCNRIVSSCHSNCPRCGNIDIKPILFKERLEEIEKEKQI